MANAKHEEGFTYLALLFLVAIMGTVLAGSGAIWSISRQRDNERELLFIGNEFRKAIGSYYERTPGTVKRYPNSLNDLLKDDRHLGTVHHLRRIYLDPMTSRPDWGIVRAPDGGIMGVYSQSSEKPIKQDGFASSDSEFVQADSYAKWRFMYQPAKNNANGVHVPANAAR
jgi:type II secretory pathway pseudopilin PulG